VLLGFEMARMGLRPVGFALVFDGRSASDFSGALGRSSNERRASAPTIGGGAGGFGAGGFRPLRCAIARSSPSRSFMRASSATS
jgi:hypothetical protein